MSSGLSTQTTLPELELVIGLGMESSCPTVRYFAAGDAVNRIAVSPIDFTEYTITPSSITSGTVTKVACSIWQADIVTDPAGKFISYTGAHNAGTTPSVYYYICLSETGCSVDRIYASFIITAFTKVNYNYTLPAAVPMTRGQAFLAAIPAPRSTPYGSGVTHLGFDLQTYVGGSQSKKKITFDGSSSASANIKLIANGGISVVARQGGPYSFAGVYTSPTSYYVNANNTNAETAVAAYGTSSAVGSLYADTTTYVAIPQDRYANIIFTAVFGVTGTGVSSGASAAWMSPLVLCTLAALHLL
eukprot:ANDGO_07220.mRNA.1 hypothetical protein